MSGHSSDGRHSFSSEPSATSSNTLNSRFSGAFAHPDNGEGSSSQRQGLVSPGRNGGLGNAPTKAQSQDSQSPLAAEDIGEEDFAHRRQRVRRSGGFLLDSSFGAGPRTRRQAEPSYNGGDAK